MNAPGHHELFHFFSTKQIRSMFLVFDTNNLLLFLVRHKNLPSGISFIAVALDFHVFLAQITRLKNSNKELVVVGHKMEKSTIKM